jgi:2-phospho-L-lactate transferase/gluconeogenesis factor (CofD/UPF0052 family)
MEKKILTIGWWSWTYNLVSWLKTLENIKLDVVVSMSDDWWSTWFLRDEYGILPPGDLRRALIALADSDKIEFLKKLFAYRFKDWFLKWQNLGNLIMKASEDITWWDYIKAIRELENIFEIKKWHVWPSTLEKTRLVAKLENWNYVIWETNIDIPKHDPKLKIVDFWVIKEKYAKILKNILIADEHFYFKEEFESILKKWINDRPSYYPEIKDLILKSDYIIFWPGDLYTSILPNILLWDIPEILRKSKAIKIYISNLFTKLGETTDFKLSDFIQVFKKYIGEDIFDYIIVQDPKKIDIDQEILKKYEKEWKKLVKNDIEEKRIIKADLINTTDIVRHDSKKLANILKKIIKNG